jgi:hypothetical protein
MTSDDSHDASKESLAGLMPLAPDPDRAERVRERCRAHLRRNRRHTARTAVITGFVWQLVAPVVVGGFCILYIAALVATTLRLQGVFH